MSKQPKTIAESYEMARQDMAEAAAEYDIDLDAPITLYDPPKTLREMIENKLHYETINELNAVVGRRHAMQATLDRLREAFGDEAPTTE